MTNIVLPDSASRSLAFYLALEEYVAGRFPEGDFFFVWRTGPSVIFGRNQQMEAEVNLPYCREHGIKIYRRKSGGGCVYSDMGNIMHSFITSPGSDPAFVFNRYMQRIALLLRNIGMDASVSGRNDIMVSGAKVSGNAFHLLPARCIVHGTMLFSTDLEAMERSITPSAEKLHRKGVSSVRQRVTNISGMTGMDIGEFSEYMVRSMCTASVSLDSTDIGAVCEMEKAYLLDSFISGRDPKH